MAQVTPQTAPASNGRGQRTRQRILDAAAQRFGAQGLSKTTVEEIARTAGVSKGIVYHHFRGKDQVFDALVERTLSDWSELPDLEAAIASGASVVGALRAAIVSAIDYARDNPMVRSLFQRDPALMVALGESAAVRDTMNQSRRALVSAIEAAIARGELRGDLDAEQAARTVHLVQMALIDHVLDPQWIQPDDQLVDTTLDVLLRGLGAPEVNQ